MLTGPASAQTITEFPLAPPSGPWGITAGPDGNLWFTESSASNVARITTAGVITRFAVSGGAGPGITAGPDGNLWYTEMANRIGRIGTAGGVTHFNLPTPNSFPWAIATGSDGNIWFTEAGSTVNQIGRITTSGVITEFPIPTGNSQPFGMTAGPDGNLWFTESGGNKVGRITTAGVITEFPIPTPNSGPSGIARGPDGNLWFTEDATNKIGRITTAGVITEFPIPGTGSGPFRIAAGADGNLWFTELTANKIGRITTSGIITEFAIPTPSSGADGIAAGSDGRLWFNERIAEKIGRITTGVTLQADLSITKGDGHAAVRGGQSITYTIVASNAGPSTVFAAAVTDTVPAGLVGATWTCTATGGGTCSPGAAGNINDAANLPAGASATYNLSGTVNGAATGNLTNTATVSTSGGVADPNPGNNSATDVDPIVTLTADNNSPSSAKVLTVGSVSTDILGPAPADENWFRFSVQAGRSYCVEVDNGKTDVSIRDSVLAVYRADGVTLLGTNDDIADEPRGSRLSRVCYAATASEDSLAKVTSGSFGTAGGFRLQVAETTLFCPWFFSGGGFEAFILVKNTTGTARTAKVTLSAPSGTVLGAPQTGIVPADGSYNLQVSSPGPLGFGLSSGSGGVLIAHDGPPGSLIATVTSLSFTSGVSFDTPAAPRLDLR